MLTVACVYSPGAGFNDDYVYRLKDAAARHCHAPHKFVALTNRRLPGVETIPQVKGWKGWWQKLELFRKDLFPGQVVYMDLDTVVVSDVTDIASCTAGFACPTNWKAANGDGKVISSAVMVWNGREDLSHIVEAFHPGMTPEYEKSWEMWGDQGHIGRFLGRPFTSLQKLFPSRILHYKTHVSGPRKLAYGPVPPAASIICFSGKPRPHQLPEDHPLYKKWTSP